MVNTISESQPNESEQKRRKQTLERAKANHLSRQLQMRLQYARLKVEHGWQRQNLNEVENLYFHHSHQRGPRPAVSSKPSWVTATPVATHPTSEITSRVETDSEGLTATQPGPLPFPVHTETEELIGETQQAKQSPTIALYSNPLDDLMNVDRPAGTDVPSVTRETPSELPPPESHSGLSEVLFMAAAVQEQLTGNPFSAHGMNTTQVTKVSTTSSSPISPQFSPLPHAPSPFHFNSVPRPDVLEGVASLEPRLSQPAKELSRVLTRQTASSSSLANTPTQSSSSFSFSSNSSLTYDSFWSSHSSSTLSYRNVLANVGAAAGSTGRVGSSTSSLTEKASAARERAIVPPNNNGMVGGAGNGVLTANSLQGAISAGGGDSWSLN